MRVAVLVLASIVGAVSGALAGAQDGTVIALHGQAAHENPCPMSPNASAIACSNYAVDQLPVGKPINLYLVVAHADPGNGIAGVSVGIDYDFSAIVWWTRCADFELTGSTPFCDGRAWPQRVTGNRIFWSPAQHCQRTEIGSDGVHAVAGAFYVYAYESGTFALIPHPCLESGPEIAVMDCNSNDETDLSVEALGSAGFGTESGCNPCVTGCGPVPVEDVSWGELKTRGGEE